jgi:hypothetical protein
VGANSTRETSQLAHDAAAAGADFVLVVPPGCYAGVLKANPTAIRNFFVDVAAASPVPVCLLFPKYSTYMSTPFGRYSTPNRRKVQRINEIMGTNNVCRIIYNFPAVSAGIDLSSDDVVDIAKAAPNMCGIMLSYVTPLSCRVVKVIANIMIVAVMSENWQELLPLSIARHSKLSPGLLTFSFHLLPSGLRVLSARCPTSRQLVSHVIF